MVRNRFCSILLAALVCLTGPSAFAQRITGDISGNVTDSSGAVVANVTVTVRNLGTGVERTANTNASGNYRIAELPIGDYKVSASAPGFKTSARQATVSAGALTASDFALEIGQRTETVEVEGTAPLVELSSNNNNYVDNAKIESRSPERTRLQLSAGYYTRRAARPRRRISRDQHQRRPHDLEQLLHRRAV